MVSPSKVLTDHSFSLSSKRNICSFNFSCRSGTSSCFSEDTATVKRKDDKAVVFTFASLALRSPMACWLQQVVPRKVQALNGKLCHCVVLLGSNSTFF